MTFRGGSALALTMVVTGFLSLPVAAQTAAESTEERILRRMEEIEKEMQQLRSELIESRAAAKQAKQQADAAKVEAQAAIDRAKTAEQHAEAAVKEAETAIHHAKEPINAAMKWHLSGYADTDFVAGDAELGNSFLSGNFNPAFHWQYKNWLLFEAEAEISLDTEGETEFELEYAQFDILVHDYLTVVLGQYLSPIGQFQERLHPSWINRLPTSPAGFGHDGAQPLSDIGVQLRGGIPINGMTITYSLAAGNGPELNDEAEISQEATARDDNKNKSLGARIGFFPVPYLEIGASVKSARIIGNDGMGPLTPSSADFFLWGADAAYTRGSWDIRFEYLDLELDPLLSATEDDPVVSLLGGQELSAWYVQTAYRLDGVSDHPIIRKFEPVVRYGEFKAEGNEHVEEEAEKRFNFGINYWFAPSIVGRFSVEYRDYFDETVENDTRYIFQFAYGF